MECLIFMRSFWLVIQSFYIKNVTVSRRDLKNSALHYESYFNSWECAYASYHLKVNMAWENEMYLSSSKYNLINTTNGLASTCCFEESDKKFFWRGYTYLDGWK